MEKQTEKQVDVSKPLNFSNKIDELNQIKSIFPQNPINDLILDRVEKINQLPNNIRLDDLQYKTEIRKHYNFSKYSLRIVFLRDIHKGNLSIEDTDKEQSQLANEFRVNINNGRIPLEKRYFLKNAGLFISAR